MTSRSPDDKAGGGYDDVPDYIPPRFLAEFQADAHRTVFGKRRIATRLAWRRWWPMAVERLNGD